MKKILLIDNDQQFIGDLQAKLAHQYELLSTDDYKIAYQIIKNLKIELLLARLPPENKIIQLQKFLRKINSKRYAAITKILIINKRDSLYLGEFLKLGITAVIIGVDEVLSWLK